MEFPVASLKDAAWVSKEGKDMVQRVEGNSGWLPVMVPSLSLTYFWTLLNQASAVSVGMVPRTTKQPAAFNSSLLSSLRDSASS